MQLRTHGVRKYPPTSALLASSAGLGWSTISAELRSHGVIEAPTIVPQHVEICLVVAGNEDGLVRRTGGGFCQEVMPKTGAIWLSPGALGKENGITRPRAQKRLSPLRRRLHSSRGAGVLDPSYRRDRRRRLRSDRTFHPLRAYGRD